MFLCAEKVDAPVETRAVLQIAKETRLDAIESRSRRRHYSRRSSRSVPGVVLAPMLVMSTGSYCYFLK